MGDRLKDYELLYIISPRVAADDVVNAIERVNALVQSSGGEVVAVDNWGRRRMAYPIKHFFEGTYVLATLRMEPAAAAPLEAALVISSEVLRHLLTEGIIPQVQRERPRFGEDRDRGRFGDDRERSAPASEERPAAAAVAVAEPPAAEAEPEAAPAPEASAGTSDAAPAAVE